MADDRDALAHDPGHGLLELLEGAVADQHQVGLGGDVVDELGHPYAVLGGDAELGEAVDPAGRVEALDGELVARRQLAERGGAVEAGEALVEDRDRLALAEDPLAPHDVGAHAQGALAEDDRVRRSGQGRRGEDGGAGREEPLHGGPSKQTPVGPSSGAGDAIRRIGQSADARVANWHTDTPDPRLS